MKTIKQQLVSGYVLSPEGSWHSCHHGRVTVGGNVNVGNMLASLELIRVQALARVQGVALEELLPQVVEAAMFIGAYVTLNIAQPYEYDEGEGTPSNEWVRQHITQAADFSAAREYAKV